jgi:murein L,D-transpeptidase YcbB/YkuD
LDRIEHPSARSELREPRADAAWLRSLQRRLACEDLNVLNGEPAANTLAEALKRFQRRHGLDADGRVGPGTLTALDVPASFRVEQIAANLGRWRSLPRTFERRSVRVNVSDESVDLMRDREVV